MYLFSAFYKLKHFVLLIHFTSYLRVYDVLFCTDTTTNVISYDKGGTCLQICMLIPIVVGFEIFCYFAYVKWYFIPALCLVLHANSVLGQGSIYAQLNQSIVLLALNPTISEGIHCVCHVYLYIQGQYAAQIGLLLIVATVVPPLLFTCETLLCFTFG